MHRFHQLLFALSLLGLSWLLMMAVHELGHILGVLATGGSIECVVLHPLAISRTDVFPNPSPGVVVWLGPILGCLIPLALLTATSGRQPLLRGSIQFFAGFCFIANGAYIALGSIEHIGDSGVMLKTGSPHWLLCAFGLLTIPTGFYLWHKLGRLSDFVKSTSLISRSAAYSVFALLVIVVLLEFALSAK